MYIKKLLIGICCTVLLIVNPFLVVASPFSEGLDKTVGETGHISASSSIWTPDNLPGAIGKMIGGVLSFLGVIFLILTIYGGFTWMLARGNEQKSEKAKKIIADSIIGLIIVLAAYAITVFIGQINSKI
ncbi:MAG: hypothetical protein ABIJ83_02220 [Patescibacteria group bacterium]|nr:pilin [Patescibacteria group bacterium]